MHMVLPGSKVSGGELEFGTLKVSKFLQQLLTLITSYGYRRRLKHAVFSFKKFTFN